MATAPLILEDKYNPNFALSAQFRQKEEEVEIVVLNSWGVPMGSSLILNPYCARRLALEILEHFPDSPEEERRKAEQY